MTFTVVHLFPGLGGDAEAIAREVAASLTASRAGGFRLAAGDVWVQPEEVASA